MSFRKTAERAWSRPDTVIAAAIFAFGPGAACALEYRENFDEPGKPEAPEGLEWNYRAELCPVKAWNKIIPGDGYAYLAVAKSWLEPTAQNTTVWPFQTLILGPVTPGHRLSMRARDAVIPGVASMIFTHREKDTLDEIDIEITADDTYATGTGHPTEAEGGWTDARFNTYANADPKTLEPSRRIQKPIMDVMGGKVSHRDGEFHAYSIEWGWKSVRFLIDGVEQAVIEDVVPQGSADLIVGLRQMPWAGQPDWDDYRTMLVDWISIEALDKE